MNALGNLHVDVAIPITVAAMSLKVIRVSHKTPFLLRRGYEDLSGAVRRAPVRSPVLLCAPVRSCALSCGPVLLCSFPVLSWVPLRSPLLSWALLASPGLSWALLGSPALSWALLGSSVLSCALCLGSPGMSCALLHTLSCGPLCSPELAGLLLV